MDHFSLNFSIGVDSFGSLSQKIIGQGIHVMEIMKSK